MPFDPHVPQPQPTPQFTTVLEVLEDVKRRITPRERWINGRMAVDKNGNSIIPWSNEAHRWCLIGAIEAATSVNNDELHDKVLCHLIAKMDMDSFQTARALRGNRRAKEMTLALWNDAQGHEAVKALLQRTIDQIKGVESRRSLTSIIKEKMYVLEKTLA